MTVVRPPRALGVITGGAISAWAFIFAAAALVVASGGPAEFRTFLAWVVGVLLLLARGPRPRRPWSRDGRSGGAADGAPDVEPDEEHVHG